MYPPPSSGCDDVGSPAIAGSCTLSSRRDGAVIAISTFRGRQQHLILVGLHVEAEARERLLQVRHHLFRACRSGRMGASVSGRCSADIEPG